VPHRQAVQPLPNEKAIEHFAAGHLLGIVMEPGARIELATS